LRGQKSNRDAIGTCVTVEAGGVRQSKFLQAGSGFLSQHTKELFFGLAGNPGPVRTRVRWPSGIIQEFKDVPVNCRVGIEEGVDLFRAEPFGLATRTSRTPAISQAQLPIPSRSSTWLIAPLAAPEFALPDLGGQVHTLQSFRGRNILLNFWSVRCLACQQELGMFQKSYPGWVTKGLLPVAINVDDPSQAAAVQGFIREQGYRFPILLANDDVIAIYTILYRYLFDRRRNLGVPTSFQIDTEGSIVKVYQGVVDHEDLQKSLGSVPRTAEERIKKALPFPGHFYSGEVRRNTFTYGVVYYEKGYLDQAVASFQQTLRDTPDYPEAHYNLGTLYLKKQMRAEAKEHFQKALQLRPDYPDALNNVGLIAAEEGRADEALGYFQEAIRRKPTNATALLNLGNLYRQHGRLGEAEQALDQAFQLEPGDPEVNYSLGMLFAQKEDPERAREYLQKAIKLRPEYPDALNNLGVLYLRSRQSTEALALFQECIRVAAHFDQPYLNLAKLYVGIGERQKAQEILRQLLELRPGHAIAQKMLDQLAR